MIVSPKQHLQKDILRKRRRLTRSQVQKEKEKL